MEFNVIDSGVRSVWMTVSRDPRESTYWDEQVLFNREFVKIAANCDKAKLHREGKQQGLGLSFEKSGTNFRQSNSHHDDPKLKGVGDDVKN